RPASCSLTDTSEGEPEPLVRTSENSGPARIGRKRRASFQLVSAKATTDNPLAIIAGKPANASAAVIGFAPRRRASASRVSGLAAKYPASEIGPQAIASAGRAPARRRRAKASRPVFAST